MVAAAIRGDRREELLGIQAAFARRAVPLADGAAVSIRPMALGDVRALTNIMLWAFKVGRAVQVDSIETRVESAYGFSA